MPSYVRPPSKKVCWIVIYAHSRSRLHLLLTECKPFIKDIYRFYCLLPKSYNNNHGVGPWYDADLTNQHNFVEKFTILGTPYLKHFCTIRFMAKTHQLHSHSQGKHSLGRKVTTKQKLTHLIGATIFFTTVLAMTVSIVVHFVLTDVSEEKLSNE